MTALDLSLAIEALLVARNPRHMQTARAALSPGYYLRAAGHLRAVRPGGQVLLATGFPVAQTFETDGPVGAIALYQALAGLGLRPVLACGAPLSTAVRDDYRVLELPAQGSPRAQRTVPAAVASLQPAAIVCIELPGCAADGRYYNMRGADISARVCSLDFCLDQVTCPTIAIGDGGNEAGMGNIAPALAALGVPLASTGCDELLVADVSNWGAYGLLAMLGHLTGRDLLGACDPLAVFRYLSQRGSVDGISGSNTLSEDGMPASTGLELIAGLRQLAEQARGAGPER